MNSTHISINDDGNTTENEEAPLVAQTTDASRPANNYGARHSISWVGINRKID